MVMAEERYRVYLCVMGLCGHLHYGFWVQGVELCLLQFVLWLAQEAKQGIDQRLKTLQNKPIQHKLLKTYLLSA